MKKPKAIWVILDPLDGPHLFTTKAKALKLYREWKKDAKDNFNDSFWEMSKPIKYIPANEEEN